MTDAMTLIFAVSAAGGSERHGKCGFDRLRPTAPSVRQPPMSPYSTDRQPEQPTGASGCTTTPTRASDRSSRRRGAQTLEVIIALPVLVIATIAIFEFGLLMLAQQAFTTAALEGAREAAKDGATTEAVALEVQRILQVHDLTLTPTGTNTTDDIRVVVERFGVPAEEAGNTSIPCTASAPAPGANEVRVTVCGILSNADNRPVPDWLDTLGFSLDGRTFELSALAVLE